MDVSLLPIGAYEPRWFMADQHMNPNEAVKAHIDLQSHFSVGIHFGSFNLANEGIAQPIIDLEKSLNDHSINPAKFQAPQNGQRFHYVKDH